MRRAIALLDDTLDFPAVDQAVEGMLAVGGDLSSARLIAAYEAGIFPWFDESTPPLWWAPEDRAILQLDQLRVSKSMRSVMRNAGFRLSMDTAFHQVMLGCKETRESRGESTWIGKEVLSGYHDLYDLGLAHSVETWLDGELVGGLYGVSIGRMFFGESMFSKVSNASKVAFIALAKWLKRHDFGPLDCQIQNNHLASLGVTEIPRQAFMDLLQKHLHSGPTLRGKWSLDDSAE